MSNMQNRCLIRKTGYKSVDRADTLWRTTSSFLINAILIVFSITSIYPIFWIIISSLKTTKDFNTNPAGLPEKLYFENYVQVIKKTLMLKFMLNSAVITFISVALILIIGFTTGYLLSRFKFRACNILYAYYMIGIIMPIHSLLVPLYILTKEVGLIDTKVGLILPYVAFGLPIAVFLIDSYVRNIPKEIEEAARIDGASFTRTMFSIVMPICKPILATVGIVSFFACWNEFIFALVLLNTKNNFTVPLGLVLFKGPYATNYPLIMTGIFVSIVPVMVLYFAFSGNIIKGMTEGALKG